MPTLTQCNPKYRKHRASGQAIVTLHGVDHYLGPHGTKASKAEYDRLIAQWLGEETGTGPIYGFAAWLGFCRGRPGVRRVDRRPRSSAVDRTQESPP